MSEEIEEIEEIDLYTPPPSTSGLKIFYDYINELDELKVTNASVQNINYVFGSHVKGIEETLKKILNHLLHNKVDGKKSYKNKKKLSSKTIKRKKY